MNENLPDVRLTSTVVQRVQGRLLGLFGGVTAKGLNSTVPSIIRTAFVTKAAGNLGGTKVQKRKELNKRKKIVKRIYKKVCLGEEINSDEMKILKRKRSWFAPNFQIPVKGNDEEPSSPKESSSSFPIRKNRRVQEPEGYIPVRKRKVTKK